MTVVLVLLVLGAFCIGAAVWCAWMGCLEMPQAPSIPDRPLQIPAPQPTIRVRFVSQSGHVLGQIDMDPRRRRPQMVHTYSKKQPPGIFLAEQRLPSGVWVYRWTGHQ